MRKGFLVLLVLTVTLVVLVACGGSSGGSDTDASARTSTGYFLDSGVAGIEYSGSLGTTGVTGVGGSFEYLENERITFLIGIVELGTAEGAPVLSPVDLTDIPADAINMVRFIMALDEDGNPENGITITTELLAAAQSWDTVDMGVAEADFFDVVTVALGADAPLSLPTAAEASSHLNSTLSCAFSGAYNGSWSGTWNSTPVGGDMGMIVLANGTIIAGGVEDDYSSYMQIGESGNVNFIDGTYDLTGAIYEEDGSGGYAVGTRLTGSGALTDANTVTGNFATTGNETVGTISMSRIGGSATAKYRFTGFYFSSNVPEGVFAIDVDANGSVTGIGFNFETSSEYTLTGTVSGNTLSLALSNTGVTASGTIDLTNGTLTGVTWTDSNDNSAGNVEGSGCSLN